jgi:hypothetical protein
LEDYCHYSLVGTQHCLTLSYSSQQNAIVERVNKEINRHVRAWIYDANDLEQYELAIPIVQRILNSAYSDRTGITPASMLFGNALDLDRGRYSAFLYHVSHAGLAGRNCQ